MLKNTLNSCNDYLGFFLLNNEEIKIVYGGVCNCYCSNIAGGIFLYNGFAANKDKCIDKSIFSDKVFATHLSAHL